MFSQCFKLNTVNIRVIKYCNILVHWRPTSVNVLCNRFLWECCFEEAAKVLQQGGGSQKNLLTTLCIGNIRLLFLIYKDTEDGRIILTNNFNFWYNIWYTSFVNFNFIIKSRKGRQNLVPHFPAPTLPSKFWHVQ